MAGWPNNDDRYALNYAIFKKIVVVNDIFSYCTVFLFNLKYYSCSIYRGIDVVRNKIKMFAQQKVTLPKGRHKIIILDEADR